MVGQPYWIEQDKEAACAVKIDGLLEKRTDIRGIDPIDAFMCSMSFVDSYLRNQAATKTLRWTTGELYFDPN